MWCPPTGCSNSLARPGFTRPTYVQREIDAEEEFDLERVHLERGHSADFRVVRVVEILIVEEFGGEHDRSDHDAVDVETGEEEVVALY